VVPEPGRDEQLLAWRRGEERLYPVVLVKPELYEQYVRLVRELADELAGARSEDALLAAYREGAGSAADAASRLELPARGELDLGLARDAAYCFRHRELVGELERAEANRRVERARAAGEEWVTVFEQASSELRPPHRLVEMHVRSGRAIHSFVEQSPDTGRPVFGVEVIRLDPMTGDWMPDVDAEGRVELPDPDEWRERIEELRRRGARPTEEEGDGQGSAQGH
jgi:hypothetical protein